MLYVILLSMLMILLSTLNVICHLIVTRTRIGFWTWIWSTRHYELGRTWLVNFNAGKARLVLFDWANNSCAIDGKMDWPVLEEKSSFKMLGLTFSSKLNWGSYITYCAKIASKKFGALIRSIEFLSTKLLCISIIYYADVMGCCCHILAGAIWNCQISYKNRYAGL